MRLQRLGKATVSLLGVILLSAAIYVVLTAVASLAGVPVIRAAPVAIAVAVAVALAVADVYTPVGRAPRTEAIQELGWRSVAIDLVVAGVVAFLVSAGSTALGVAAGIGLLANQTVVILLGAGAGYVAFILRNRDYYVRR
ncbi:hypothetical protein ACFQH6_17255 [Halobacteriaceae archaeon GCM10025711]